MKGKSKEESEHHLQFVNVNLSVNTIRKLNECGENIIKKYPFCCDSK
jgi:hypothetical protein